MNKKNYVIFGATSGIGESCVRRIASESTRLILVGRNQKKLSDLKDNLPGEVYLVQYDFNDLSNVKTIFKVCTENGFKLDGMVYSVGIDAFCPVKVNRVEESKNVMNINCMAFVEAAKCFYSKRYSKDGASIITISSIASLTCEQGMLSYAMSKAAMNAAVKVMSKEFVKRKIRVNAILPAGVDTKMALEKGKLLAGIYEEQPQDVTVNPQPLGNIPSDIIAEQVNFLLSESSSYTTGELFTISGGRDY